MENVTIVRKQLVETFLNHIISTTEKEDISEEFLKWCMAVTFSVASFGEYSLKVEKDFIIVKIQDEEIKVKY